MEMDFIRNRITELRVKKGVSEYQLSYDLGHSKNYIHNIVTGYSQPSVKELLYLIDTLGMICTPFTGHPVGGVLLCGTRMSTKGNV